MNEAAKKRMKKNKEERNDQEAKEKNESARKRMQKNREERNDQEAKEIKE